MNEKLHTFSMTSERLDLAKHPSWIRFLSHPPDTHSDVAKEPKGKMNIFKCRCLSQRFIFIHFTNTQKNRRFSYRSEGPVCLGLIDCIRRSQFTLFYISRHYRRLADFLFLLKVSAIKISEHKRFMHEQIELCDSEEPTCNGYRFLANTRSSSMISIRPSFLSRHWQTTATNLTIVLGTNRVRSNCCCFTRAALDVLFCAVPEMWSLSQAKWKANFIRHGAKMANGYLKLQTSWH